MRRLWIPLGVVVVFGFAVLGWIGTRIYQERPPIPDRVVTTDGREMVGPGEGPARLADDGWSGERVVTRGRGGEVEAARRAAA
jgi:hypothetical protein